MVHNLTKEELVGDYRTTIASCGKAGWGAKRLIARVTIDTVNNIPSLKFVVTQKKLSCIKGGPRILPTKVITSTKYINKAIKAYNDIT